MRVIISSILVLGIYSSIIDAFGIPSFTKPTDIVGSITNTLNSTIEKSGGNLNHTLESLLGGIEKFKNVPTALGGSLYDVIHETAVKIPQILKGGIWAYDDYGNLTTLTLEVPPFFEIARDVRNDVFFTLYTNANKQGEAISVNDINFKNTHFNPKLPTVFATHGWIQSSKSQACTYIRDAYLKLGNFNVILIDWSNLSKKPYVYSANMVTQVGKQVARMVDFLITQGASPDSIRLVGHSLGAHVAGLGGYYASYKVGYVVGLDPALPLFFTSTHEARISTLSAKNVEIIHTNAGLLGVITPLGHADFFPNGGSNQEGCLVINTACSHIRSVYYYAESINNPESFIANMCRDHGQLRRESCIGPTLTLGTYRESLSRHGAFYLTTSDGESTKLYGLGMKGTTFKSEIKPIN